MSTKLVENFEKSFSNSLKNAKTIEDYDILRYWVLRSEDSSDLDELVNNAHEKVFSIMVDKADSFESYLLVYSISWHILIEGKERFFSPTVASAAMSFRKKVIMSAVTEKDMLRAIDYIPRRYGYNELECSDVRDLGRRLANKSKNFKVLLCLLIELPDLFTLGSYEERKILALANNFEKCALLFEKINEHTNEDCTDVVKKMLKLANKEQLSWLLENQSFINYLYLQKEVDDN